MAESSAQSSAQNRFPQKSHYSGTTPPDVWELPRVEDRLSFVYLEHARIDRENNAITAVSQQGTIAIPGAQLSVLLLGPGTTVTQAAMRVIGDNGATVAWVGEHGVRFYAAGSPLTHSSALLQRQAFLVSRQKTRLAVARRMYEMRFPGENFAHRTLWQLRGMEGARVRSIYREMSRQTGVIWQRRDYNPLDFDDSDDINKALSAANVCLYGLCHAVIVALGCSPGLGFIHVGHERSFVYDIADLYKAETTIPVAFTVTAAHPDNLESAVRTAMRNRFYDVKFLEKIVADIRDLFGADSSVTVSDKTDDSSDVSDVSDTSNAADTSVPSDLRDGENKFADDTDHLQLWDPNGDVAAGTAYGTDGEISD